MKPVHPTARATRAGFTLIELLAVVGVVSAMLAIVLAVLASARSSAHVLLCNNNLRHVTLATAAYTIDNRTVLPRVNHEEFSVAGNAIHADPAAMLLTDPFGLTAPKNDVPAAMFLLLRQEYVIDSASFVAPSLRSHRPDAYGVNGPSPLDQTTFTLIGEVTSDPSNLSYGYTNPYPGYTPGLGGNPDLLLTSESMPGGQVVFADRGPRFGIPYDGDTAPVDRSNVHGQGGEETGQCVAYPDGRVVFSQSPDVGASLPGGLGRDKIYGEATAFARGLGDTVIHPVLGDSTFVEISVIPADPSPPSRPSR